MSFSLQGVIDYGNHGLGYTNYLQGIQDPRLWHHVIWFCLSSISGGALRLLCLQAHVPSFLLTPFCSPSAYLVCSSPGVASDYLETFGFVWTVSNSHFLIFCYSITEKCHSPQGYSILLNFPFLCFRIFGIPVFLRSLVQVSILWLILLFQIGSTVFTCSIFFSILILSVVTYAAIYSKWFCPVGGFSDFLDLCSQHCSVTWPQRCFLLFYLLLLFLFIYFTGSITHRTFRGGQWSQGRFCPGALEQGIMDFSPAEMLFSSPDVHFLLSYLYPLVPQSLATSWS